MNELKTYPRTTLAYTDVAASFSQGGTGVNFITMATAADTLKALLEAENRRKHPELPDRFRVPIKVRTTTANELTKAIISLIKLSGFQAERINTMGRVIDDSKLVENCLGQKMKIGSSRYIPTTATRGSSDISATIKGKSVKVEVKVGKDRQSPSQVKYQADIERAGGTYVIARDFDSFYLWFQEFTK